MPINIYNNVWSVTVLQQICWAITYGVSNSRGQFIVTYCLLIRQKKLEKQWWGSLLIHDDVIKWKKFPRYWPFVRWIHRSPVNCSHKYQRRGTLMFSLIYVWINGWEYNREAGDLRRYRAHYDVIVMQTSHVWQPTQLNSLIPRRCGCNLKLVFQLISGIHISTISCEVASGECHKSSLIISQHWFG